MSRDTKVVFLHHPTLVSPVDLINSEILFRVSLGACGATLPEAQAMWTDHQDVRGLGSAFHCGTKDGSVSDSRQRGSQSQQPSVQEAICPPFCRPGDTLTILCLVFSREHSLSPGGSRLWAARGPDPGHVDTPLYHIRQLSRQVGDAGSSVQPRHLQPAECPKLDSEISSAEMMPFSALRNRDFRKRHPSETGWLESSVPLWKANAPCKVPHRTTPRWSLRPPSETPASCAALPNGICLASTVSLCTRPLPMCAALGATRARTPAHRPSGPLNGGGKGGGGTGTEDPPGGPTAATAAGLPVGAGSAPCCVLRGHLRTALRHAGPLGVGHQNVLTNEEAGPHARHGPGVGAGIPPPS